MSTIVGIILCLMLGAIFGIFAISLVASGKRADLEAEVLAKEQSLKEQAEEIAELRAYRDSINGILKDSNCRGNKRRKITIEKTNGKKELQTILEEHPELID